MRKQMSSQSMVRRGLLIFALMVFVVGQLALDVTPAQACDCPQPTPNVSFDFASIVFSGNVIERNNSNYSPLDVIQEYLKGFQTRQPPYALFLTGRVWKGEVGETVLVQTGSGSCTFDFEVGKTYVVYASEETDQNEDYLYTEYCMGTIEISFAEADLIFLGDGSPPTPDLPPPEATTPSVVFVWIIIAIVGIAIITASVIMFRRRRAT